MLVGVLFGLAAAALWTVANVFIQPASERFGAVGALVWAQILGGLMVVPFALYHEDLGAALQAGATLWPTIIAAGFAAMLAYTGLFEALRLGQLALVIPVTSLWVILSAAIGVLWLGNTVSTWGYVGLVWVVVGNVVVARYGPSAEEPASTETAGGGVARGSASGGSRPTATPVRALMWAGASSLGFGVMVPLVDVLGSQMGRLWALPAVWGAELLLGLPLWLWMGSLRRRPQSPTGWYIASRVAVFEILGFVCLSFGMHYADVTTVTPASSVGTALAVLWGVFLLGERPPRKAVLGAALAAAGVFIAAL